MAKKKTKAGRKSKAAAKAVPVWRRVARAVLRVSARVLGWGFLVCVLWVALYSVVRPVTTPYMLAESWRRGGVERVWRAGDEISVDMMRAVVAAEDANFCNHWGFDMSAIRDAIADGAARGGSTISQQTVKNLFLWQGRSWPRKVLEAALTPVAELFWSKRRMLELYLNMIEFDAGVFGVEAAAQRYFGVGADAVTPLQAARLAAVLPDPRNRSASAPSAAVETRARAIADGAATIARDGRDACFAR